MSEEHPLDHPDARTAVLDSVSSAGSLTDAGAAAGVNKTRLSRYLKANPDFALEVAAARERGKVVGHHAPRMLPPNPGEIATLGDPAERARKLVAKCEKLLDDESAPPAVRAKALHVLAEYDLGSIVHARRLRSQREDEKMGHDQGDDAGVQVVFTLPPNGTEAHNNNTITVEVL